MLDYWVSVAEFHLDTTDINVFPSSRYYLYPDRKGQLKLIIISKTKS